MSEQAPESTTLVARLRALAVALHEGEVDPSARTAALRHLDDALALLASGTPRSRWYEVDRADAGATRARNRELSTFTGALNALAPPMNVREGSLPDGRAALIGRVRLDRLREGPPRAAHGGVVAGLFDELLGAGQRIGGGPGGVTARLTVRYRRPTPLDTELEMRAWIDDERTRRIIVRGDCRVVGDDAATVTAEAEGVFLRVDFDGLEKGLRERRPGEPPRPAPRGTT